MASTHLSDDEPEELTHENESFTCEVCSEVFEKRITLRNHFMKHKKNKIAVKSSGNISTSPNNSISSEMTKDTSPSPKSYLQSYKRTLELAQELSKKNKLVNGVKELPNALIAPLNNLQPNQRYTIPKKPQPTKVQDDSDKLQTGNKRISKSYVSYQAMENLNETEKPNGNLSNIKRINKIVIIKKPTQKSVKSKGCPSFRFLEKTKDVDEKNVFNKNKESTYKVVKESEIFQTRNKYKILKNTRKQQSKAIPSSQSNTNTENNVQLLIETGKDSANNSEPISFSKETSSKPKDTELDFQSNLDIQNNSNINCEAVFDFFENGRSNGFLQSKEINNFINQTVVEHSVESTKPSDTCETTHCLITTKIPTEVQTDTVNLKSDKIIERQETLNEPKLTHEQDQSKQTTVDEISDKTGLLNTKPYNSVSANHVNESCLPYDDEDYDISSNTNRAIYSSEQATFNCFICNKKFKKKVNLGCHMRIHKPKKEINRETISMHASKRKRLLFKCDTCFKTFTSNINFKNHCTIHEEKPQNFKCRYCKKTFARQLILLRHERMHNKDNNENIDCKPRGNLVTRIFKCSKCAICFNMKEGLKEHKRFHCVDSTERVCNIMSSDFIASVLLMRRKLKLQKIKPLKCQECGKRFRNEKKFFKHESMHRRELNRIFKCKLCAEFFNEIEDLKTHKLEHKVTKVEKFEDKPFSIKQEVPDELLVPELPVQIKQEPEEYDDIEDGSVFQEQYSSCLESVMSKPADSVKIEPNVNIKTEEDKTQYWIIPLTDYSMIKTVKRRKSFSNYGKRLKRVNLEEVFVKVLEVSPTTNGPFQCKVPASTLKEFSNDIIINIEDIKYVI